jgi:hypothetical protein
LLRVEWFIHLQLFALKNRKHKIQHFAITPAPHSLAQDHDYWRVLELGGVEKRREAKGVNNMGRGICFQELAYSPSLQTTMRTFTNDQ